MQMEIYYKTKLPLNFGNLKNEKKLEKSIFVFFMCDHVDF